MNDIIKNVALSSHNAYVISYGKEDFIVYLNTSDFVIINNYYGIAAHGSRNYNYDEKKVIITFEVVNDAAMTISTMIALIGKYEKKLKTKNVEIERII